MGTHGELKGKRKRTLVRAEGMNIPTPHGLVKTYMEVNIETVVRWVPHEDSGIQEMGEGLHRRGEDSARIQGELEELAERICEIVRIGAAKAAPAAQAELDFSLSGLEVKGD